MAGTPGTTTFLAYAVTDNDAVAHQVQFIGKFDAEPHEDAVERGCDELLNRLTQRLPRSSESPDVDGWDLTGHEAVLAFPADTYWQIDAPRLRGMKLGYGTDSNNPRRIRARF